MSAVERILECAAKHVGAPYIWQAKGDMLWTPQGLVRNLVVPAVEPADVGSRAYAIQTAFDCSGLVTVAIAEAGGPDWRATHNAQTLYDTLRQGPAVNYALPHLRLYGVDRQHIHHVAIGIPTMNTCLVIEAAGGDEKTHVPTPGARVFFHYETRHDLVGQVAFPAF